MYTIEKILANAAPTVTKTDKHEIYYWELGSRDMDLVHYISDDRWEGNVTAFGEMSPLSSEEIGFVRKSLDL